MLEPRSGRTRAWLPLSLAVLAGCIAVDKTLARGTFLVQARVVAPAPESVKLRLTCDGESVAVDHTGADWASRPVERVICFDKTYGLTGTTRTLNGGRPAFAIAAVASGCIPAHVLLKPADFDYESGGRWVWRGEVRLEPEAR